MHQYLTCFKCMRKVTAWLKICVFKLNCKCLLEWILSLSAKFVDILSFLLKLIPETQLTFNRNEDGLINLKRDVVYVILPYLTGWRNYKLLNRQETKTHDTMSVDILTLLIKCWITWKRAHSHVKKLSHLKSPHSWQI